MNNEISSQIPTSEVTGPGETRRRELAQEYEAVPSAQAFIAVCEQFLEARYEAEKWAELVLTYRDRAARAATEVAALKRERDEALADKEIARLAREFVVKLDKWLAPREDATYDEAKAAERALVIACRARATPVSGEPKP